ncbi:Asp-tRNA(Asn)/Glu-tRNA(Gln) amidotransferase subunit GatC [Scatolibacter rhodanostii]|uniref:Asp-tRNA(Asn)/Glu-tRNA(Gln) amidotransferase subunit GatC n=1 Tax=Scatolibacter rhodanostii TaxID=2014781 RepID=UPI000C0889DF|nr:Asp-tRNA(Asn)/Glu-tRNA(Gln) amidotransferase subunit GatC [Scatolibacter rhodanostii]
MITQTELEKIAALAKLSLDKEDTQALLNDVSSILDFANAIAEVEVGELNLTEEKTKELREDIIYPSTSVEDILSNAAEQRDGYFVARKLGGLTDE